LFRFILSTSFVYNTVEGGASEFWKHIRRIAFLQGAALSTTRQGGTEAFCDSAHRKNFLTVSM
jgi:hypothetical protein